jgi:hypothetical protein
MMITFLGCKPYLIDKYNWSIATQGFYGSFAYFTFALGFSFLIIPALLGKAQFIRFFFGGGVWSAFPNMAYGIYMCCPMVCLFYFLSISNSLHVDYQMFFYYFCGNFIFTILFVNILYVLVDRPFNSLMRLSDDVATANECTTFKIEDYKTGLILGSDSQVQNE